MECKVCLDLFEPINYDEIKYFKWFNMCKNCFLECINIDSNKVFNENFKYGYQEIIECFGFNKFIEFSESLYDEKYKNKLDLINKVKNENQIKLHEEDYYSFILALFSKFNVFSNDYIKKLNIANESLNINFEPEKNNIILSSEEIELSKIFSSSLIDIFNDDSKNYTEIFTSLYEICLTIFDISLTQNGFDNRLLMGIDYFLLKNFGEHEIKSNFASKIYHLTVNLFDNKHKKLQISSLVFSIEHEINCEYAKLMFVEENKLLYNHGRCNCGNGVIMSNYLCSGCNKLYCDVCGKEKIIPHECKKEDIETLNELQKTSRCCPKCGIFIEKKSGCPIMFCTNCKTTFNYDTNKILNGNLHNPERMEYMEKEKIKDDRFNYEPRFLDEALKFINEIFMTPNLFKLDEIRVFEEFNNFIEEIKSFKFSKYHLNSIISKDLNKNKFISINDLISSLPNYELEDYVKIFENILMLNHDKKDKKYLSLLYISQCVFNYFNERKKSLEIISKYVISLQQKIILILNDQNQNNLGSKLHFVCTKNLRTTIETIKKELNGFGFYKLNHETLFNSGIYNVKNKELIIKYKLNLSNFLDFFNMNFL